MDIQEKPAGRRGGNGGGATCKAVSPVEIIDAAKLFNGRSEIALRFGEAVYHLKITRFGKLILNK